MILTHTKRFSSQVRPCHIGELCASAKEGLIASINATVRLGVNPADVVEGHNGDSLDPLKPSIGKAIDGGNGADGKDSLGLDKKEAWKRMVGQTLGDVIAERVGSTCSVSPGDVEVLFRTTSSMGDGDGDDNGNGYNKRGKGGNVGVKEEEKNEEGDRRDNSKKRLLMAAVNDQEKADNDIADGGTAATISLHLLDPDLEDTPNLDLCVSALVASGLARELTADIATALDLPPTPPPLIVGGRGGMGEDGDEDVEGDGDGVVDWTPAKMVSFVLVLVLFSG